jgi:hypothetical protein
MVANSLTYGSASAADRFLCPAKLAIDMLCSQAIFICNLATVAHVSLQRAPDGDFVGGWRGWDVIGIGVRQLGPNQ